MHTSPPPRPGSPFPWALHVIRMCSGISVALEDAGDPTGCWWVPPAPPPGGAEAAAWRHLSNLTGQSGSPVLTNEAVKTLESVHSWGRSSPPPTANLALFIWLFLIPSGAVACCLHCGSRNNPGEADPRGQWWHVVADASSCKAFLSETEA